ncbi:hypothetical protein O3P69_009341 [Scylla paramamosain]|uniref:Uncharacterized protein n=1 Tax=Scylla paramamosain TaxID=85552 RepID=A0AAW0TAU9_SCYPA
MVGVRYEGRVEAGNYVGWLGRVEAEVRSEGQGWTGWRVESVWVAKSKVFTPFLSPALHRSHNAHKAVLLMPSTPQDLTTITITTTTTTTSNWPPQTNLTAELIYGDYGDECGNKQTPGHGAQATLPSTPQCDYWDEKTIGKTQNSRPRHHHRPAHSCRHCCHHVPAPRTCASSGRPPPRGADQGSKNGRSESRGASLFSLVLCFGEAGRRPVRVCLRRAGGSAGRPAAPHPLDERHEQQQGRAAHGAAGVWGSHPCVLHDTPRERGPSASSATLQDLARHAAGHRGGSGSARPLVEDLVLRPGHRVSVPPPPPPPLPPGRQALCRQTQAARQRSSLVQPSENTSQLKRK